jgi:hypothetical protein
VPGDDDEPTRAQREHRTGGARAVVALACGGDLGQRVHELERVETMSSLFGVTPSSTAAQASVATARSRFGETPLPCESAVRTRILRLLVRTPQAFLSLLGRCNA